MYNAMQQRVFDSCHVIWRCNFETGAIWYGDKNGEISPWCDIGIEPQNCPNIALVSISHEGTKQWYHTAEKGNLHVRMGIWHHSPNLLVTKLYRAMAQFGNAVFSLTKKLSRVVLVKSQENSGNVDQFRLRKWKVDGMECWSCADCESSSRRTGSALPILWIQLDGTRHISDLL